MENTLENAQAFMLKTNRSNQDITNIEMMVDYAASVRPVVVLPSEDQGGCIALDLVPDLDENEQAFFVAGFQTCIRWLNNNPDLTFTSQIPHGLEPELPAKCYKCGGKMVIVRPGEWECEKCGY